MPNFTITYWTGTVNTVMAQSAWDAALFAGYDADYLKAHAVDADYERDAAAHTAEALSIWNVEGDWCCTVAPEGDETYAVLA